MSFMTAGFPARLAPKKGSNFVETRMHLVYSAEARRDERNVRRVGRGGINVHIF
jgi:hypothetical protein